MFAIASALVIVATAPPSTAPADTPATTPAAATTPTTTAPATATTTTFDLSGFTALPEDPPPKEIVRGNHYWVSNEERPENFRADLEKVQGGVLVGVGGEQNFVYAGWCKPDVMVLMDFDGAIPDMHRLYASAFRRAATKEDFVKFFALQNLGTLNKALAEDYPDKKVRARINDVVKESRANLRVHAERIGKGFVDRKVPTFLNDDAQYAYVRQLYLDGRVFMVRGDLTAKATMQAIASASKKAKLPVRVLYLSNAEQYFGYSADYRANILAQPFDEKSLVLRTMSWPKWGYAKESNAYHHNITGGIAFQSWVADASTKSVASVLDAAERKNGVSHLWTPPNTPAPPPPATNADGTVALAPLPGSTATPTTTPAPPSIPVANAPPVEACLSSSVAGMSCVPGGPFIRGTEDSRKVSKPAHPQSTVWVQTFYMDVYEVTVADYKACEKEKKCKHAGPNYEDFSAPKQPITGVSWYDAKQFCEVHGKRLPTEMEWEHAARGDDGRTYPWGNEPATCKRTVMQIDAGRSCGKPQNSKGHEDVGRPEPVGSKPATLYGLYDMAGNSWEWVSDWFSESYDECGAACAGVDPKGPCGGAEPCAGHKERVVRGGSWFWPAPYATTYHRRAHMPANNPVFHHFGFRCASSLTGATSLSGKGLAGSAPKSP